MGALADAISENNFDEILRLVQTDKFNYMLTRSYLDENKHGYYIGYIGTDLVMVISGTRSIVEWILNMTDQIYDETSTVAANKKAARLEKIAIKEGVDILVGHSRGAQTISKMNAYPDSKKLALNGAMRLIPKQKRGKIINLHQNIPPDVHLSRYGGSKKQKRYPLATNKQEAYHFISRDYKGYKGSATLLKMGRHDGGESLDDGTIHDDISQIIANVIQDMGTEQLNELINL